MLNARTRSDDSQCRCNTSPDCHVVSNFCCVIESLFLSSESKRDGFLEEPMQAGILPYAFEQLLEWERSRT